MMRSIQLTVTVLLALLTLGVRAANRRVTGHRRRPTNAGRREWRNEETRMIKEDEDVHPSLRHSSPARQSPRQLSGKGSGKGGSGGTGGSGVGWTENGYDGCLSLTSDELASYWEMGGSMAVCGYVSHTSDGTTVDIVVGGSAYGSSGITTNGGGSNSGNGNGGNGGNNGNGNNNGSNGNGNNNGNNGNGNNNNGDNNNGNGGNGNGNNNNGGNNDGNDNGNGNGDNNNGNGDGDGGDGNNYNYDGNAQKNGNGGDGNYNAQNGDGNGNDQDDQTTYYYNPTTGEYEEVVVVDYGDTDEDVDTPYDAFNIEECSTYHDLWMWDLALSCGEENRPNNPNCQCAFAEELLAEGKLTCDEAKLCPPDCPICLTCMQVAGCKREVKTVKRRSRAIRVAKFMLFIAVPIFIAIFVLWTMKRKRRLGTLADLKQHLMGENEKRKDDHIGAFPAVVDEQDGKRVWLAPVDFSEDDGTGNSSSSVSTFSNSKNGDPNAPNQDGADAISAGENTNGGSIQSRLSAASARSMGLLETAVSGRLFHGFISRFRPSRSEPDAPKKETSDNTNNANNANDADDEATLSTGKMNDLAVQVFPDLLAKANLQPDAMQTRTELSEQQRRKGQVGTEMEFPDLLTNWEDKFAQLAAGSTDEEDSDDADSSRRTDGNSANCSTLDNDTYGQEESTLGPKQVVVAQSHSYATFADGGESNTEGGIGDESEDDSEGSSEDSSEDGTEDDSGDSTDDDDIEDDSDGGEGASKIGTEVDTRASGMASEFSSLPPPPGTSSTITDMKMGSSHARQMMSSMAVGNHIIKAEMSNSRNGNGEALYQGELTDQLAESSEVAPFSEPSAAKTRVYIESTTDDNKAWSDRPHRVNMFATLDTPALVDVAEDSSDESSSDQSSSATSQPTQSDQNDAITEAAMAFDANSITADNYHRHDSGSMLVLSPVRRSGQSPPQSVASSSASPSMPGSLTATGVDLMSIQSIQTSKLPVDAGVGVAIPPVMSFGDSTASVDENPMVVFPDLLRPIPQPIVLLDDSGGETSGTSQIAPLTDLEGNTESDARKCDDPTESDWTMQRVGIDDDKDDGLSDTAAEDLHALLNDDNDDNMNVASSNCDVVDLVDGTHEESSEFIDLTMIRGFHLPGDAASPAKTTADASKVPHKDIQLQRFVGSSKLYPVNSSDDGGCDNASIISAPSQRGKRRKKKKHPWKTVVMMDTPGITNDDDVMYCIEHSDDEAASNGRFSDDQSSCGLR